MSDILSRDFWVRQDKNGNEDVLYELTAVGRAVGSVGGSLVGSALGGVGKGVGQGADELFKGLLGDNWKLYLAGGGVIFLLILLRK